MSEGIPKNQIKTTNTITQVEHEDNADAKRVVQVDKDGVFVDSSNPSSTLETFIRNGAPQVVTEDTVDPTNNRPLPVKLTGVQGDVLIEAENLNLQVQLEGQYDAIDNPKPDSVGVVSHTRGLTQDRTKQTQRTTAQRGSTDTDTVSLDVSIHDHAGNQFSPANPVPTSDASTHTKLDTLHSDNVAIEGKIDTTNTKLDTIHSDLVAIEGKQDTGNASLASIDSKLTTTNTSLSGIQTELDSVDYTMNEAFNKANAIAGQLDDVATTAATEDNVAPIRITPQRAAHTNLRNVAGTEVGTAGTPLRTDPTGTTTQPVSAASLPLPAGAATSANQATEITSLQLIDDLPHTQNGALNKGVPIMGQLDDTATTVATEDNVAVARVTPQRAVHVNLRNQAGTEIGTVANPIQTSATVTGTPLAFSSKFRADILTSTIALPINTYTNIYSYTGTGVLVGFSAEFNNANITVRLQVDGETLIDGATLTILNGLLSTANNAARYQSGSGIVINASAIDFSLRNAIRFASSVIISANPGGTARNFSQGLVYIQKET